MVLRSRESEKEMSRALLTSVQDPTGKEKREESAGEDIVAEKLCNKRIYDIYI
jgi:hypothetical protein